MASLRRPPGEAVPWVVRAAAAWCWRVALIGVVVTALFYLLWIFRLVTVPVFIALLLSALLQPAVIGLCRLRVPRLLAAAAVLVGGIAAVGGVFYGLSELVLTGLTDLGNTVSRGIAQLQQWLDTGPLQLGFVGFDQLTTQIQQWVHNNTQRITQGAITTVTVVVQLVAGLLLALVVTFFFLYDGRRIWGWLVRLFPDGVQGRINAAGGRAWSTLAGYVQGIVVVAIFDAVLIMAVLFGVGLPATLAVPLGVLVFFGAFVPILGAFATGLLAVLATLVTEGLLDAVIVLGGILAVQQIEGNILQPLIFSRTARLHPLAVLLAVTAGAIVAGIAGAVIAVPLAAVINNTMAYFFRRTRAGRQTASAPERREEPQR